MENITEAILPNVPKMAQLLSFSWIDYTLFFMMFFISALIGIYFGCFASKENTTAEYLLGSRNMGVFPVAVSLIAGHLSGITLLGVPAEIYMYGGQYFVCILTAVLVSIGMLYIYLPTFYALQVNSSYEYLKLRFDDKIRSIALLLYVIASLFYIPIVIYVPALAFNQVSGIEIHLVTPIICAVCIFYTTIGGLKAVVWTDTLQFVVTLAALFMVFILGIIQAGGFGNIVDIASKGDRLDYFNMSPDPTIRTTFWGVSIGMTVGWISALGINPSSVQRFMSVPSLNKAKATVLLFGLGVILTKCLTCFSGYIMYAKYYDCDPYTAKKISAPDQILPYYVMDVAANIPGLSGIFISGIFSTALSTMSAHLNTLAGTIYEDFIYKYMPSKTTDRTANNIIKATVVISGSICVGLVFVVERLGGVIQISGCFSGITTGPLLGLFTLGMLFPRATTKGALYGSLISLSIMTYIVGGFQYHYLNKNIRYSYKPLSVEGCTDLNETISNLSNNTSSFINFTTESYTISHSLPTESDQPFYIFRLSFYWYPVIGAVLVVVIGLLVSYISGEENEAEKRYNKKLYSPLIHRWVPTEPTGYKSVPQASEFDKINSQIEDACPTYQETMN